MCQIYVFPLKDHLAQVMLAAKLAERTGKSIVVRPRPRPRRKPDVGPTNPGGAAA
jgi:hypothetical protein